MARVAIGSFLSLVVLLIGGALPAFSHPAPAGDSGITVQLLEPRSRVAAPNTLVPGRALPLRVENPVVYRQEKAAAERRYQLWRQRRGLARMTSPSSGALTSVFNHLNQPGITDATDPVFGGTPADSTGAIGPSSYVEAIDSELAVYSNTDLSAPPATVDGRTFVGDSEPGSTCDIQVQWDQEAARWLYSALHCAAPGGAQGFYFGWSKTADATPLDSNWCRYLVSTGSSYEDYPRLGHDDSQIIVGTNSFAHDGRGIYTASHIFVFDKPANGATTCPTGTTEESTMLRVNTIPADFTPVPANIADGSASGYVVSARSYSDQAHIDLYTIGRQDGVNAVLGTTAVTVPAFTVPASVPQPGGTDDVLDSLDTRLTQAVAFTDPATGKEGIWTQHTIDGGGPSVVRWYELTPGSTTPRWSGTVGGPDGAFAFNGAISPAENGSSAVLTYNSGSLSSNVEWRAQDVRASAVDDIRLAMSTEVDHDVSCPSFGFFGDAPCQWGAYAGASPDPANPCVAWGTTMLTVAPSDAIGDPQWGTQNAAIDTSTGTCEVTAGVIKSGFGAGTVTSNPGGIDCGPTCSKAYDAGTPVTLTATPAVGSVFAGWSGACSGIGACDLTLDKAKAAIATFTPIDEQLSVSKSGSGAVTSSPAGINCGSTCSNTFDYGTNVTLTATPAAGSNFTGWSGDCSGAGLCTVSLTQARSVSATFSLLPVTLTVSKAGLGSGTVSSNPLGIRCGRVCSRNFLYGEAVALMATPAAGSVFSGWSDSCSGKGACVVTMDHARSVVAKFSRAPCVVPRLKGKGLAAAKRALAEARCKLGSIARAYSEVVKKWRVISQKPKPGEHRRAGTRVDLVVSRGKQP